MKKRWVSLLLTVGLLTGCSFLGGGEPLSQADAFRKQAAQGGQFQAALTATLGTLQYEFSMDCQFSSDGGLTFTVTAPETIAGITGTVSGQEGQLIFDGAALDFGPMAGGQLTPVSGPWVLVNCWKEGYVTACGQEEAGLRITMPMAAETQALICDTWLDPENGIPIYAEVCYNGERVLTLTLSNFTFDNTGDER